MIVIKAIFSGMGSSLMRQQMALQLKLLVANRAVSFDLAHKLADLKLHSVRTLQSAVLTWEAKWIVRFEHDGKVLVQGSSPS